MAENLLKIWPSLTNTDKLRIAYVARWYLGSITKEGDLKQIQHSSQLALLDKEQLVLALTKQSWGSTARKLETKTPPRRQRVG